MKLTAKQLREYLSTLPDDFVVVVAIEGTTKKGNDKIYFSNHFLYAHTSEKKKSAALCFLQENKDKESQ